MPQELLEGLNEVDWSDRVKDMQRTWIGKSQGAYFDFKVQVSGRKFEGWNDITSGGRSQAEYLLSHVQLHALEHPFL